MGSINEQLIDLLTNGVNSPNLLITNRVQLVIGPQLETDQVSQSFFEKSSLNDMTQSVQKKKIKETIQKDLEDIGIWNNIETIENNLTKMKIKNEKATAMQQQINMCKEIVHVPSKDKYLFQFSKKVKQFDIQHLKNKLLKLIEKSNVDNNQLDHTDELIQYIKDNPRNVIGRHLEHEWSDKKWKGRVIALHENEFELNIRHLTVHITHSLGTLLQNLFCQHKHLSYNHLTV
jgi:hypothetical protein